MAMIIGLAIFLLSFVFISANSRNHVLNSMGGAGKWVVDWAPFSYIILVLVIILPVIGLQMVRNAPPRVEESNPMAKYRNNDDVVDE